MIVNTSKVIVRGTRLFLLGQLGLASGGERQPLRVDRQVQLLAYLAVQRTWVGREEILRVLFRGDGGASARANLRKVLHRTSHLKWARSLETHGDALRLRIATDIDLLSSGLELSVSDISHDLPSPFVDPRLGQRAPDAYQEWLNVVRKRSFLLWRLAVLSACRREPSAVARILCGQLLLADPADEEAAALHADLVARSGTPPFVLRQSRLTSADGAHLDERPDELMRLRDAIVVNRAPLVTITGPLGIGKTFVAELFSEELRVTRQAHCVWVELADLKSVVEVQRRLRSILRISSADSLQSGFERIRSNRVIAVLDGAEHLACPSSDQRELLREFVFDLASTASVQVIVTSQWWIDLPEECVIEIFGLEVPKQDDVSAEASAAVRFLRRQAARLNVASLADADTPQLARLARNLDGHPLALLHAVRLAKVIPVQDAAHHFTRSPRRIESRESEAIAASQLVDVFERTWALLGTKEQVALSALSRLHGEFSVDFALFASSASMSVLGALVSGSLVRRRHTDDRFVLWVSPVISRLVLGKSKEGAGIDDAIKARCRRYCMSLLSKAMDRSLTPSGAWSKVLDADLTQLELAWSFAVDEADESFLRYAVDCLPGYLEVSGRCQQANDLLNYAVRSARFQELSRGLRASVWLRVARLCLTEADYHGALQAGQLSYQIAESCTDFETAIRALGRMSNAHCLLQQPEAAVPLCQKAMRLAEELGSDRMLSHALCAYAVAQMELGEFGDAEAALHRALQFYRRLDDVRNEVATAIELANVYIGMSRGDDAVVLLDAAIQRASKSGMHLVQIYCQSAKVAALLSQRQPAEALELGRQVITSGSQAMDPGSLGSHLALVVLAQSMVEGRVDGPLIERARRMAAKSPHASGTREDFVMAAAATWITNGRVEAADELLIALVRESRSKIRASFAKQLRASFALSSLSRIEPPLLTLSEAVDAALSDRPKMVPRSKPSGASTTKNDRRKPSAE